MNPNNNDAAGGASHSDVGLAAAIASAEWQQGVLLPTKDVMQWLPADRIKAQEIEACMAFAFFTPEDGGRRRAFVARFNSPTECKAAVDEHNMFLREKAANLNSPTPPDA